MNIAFYICSAVAIISTVMVITGLNAVHSLLYFIVSLLAVGLIFFVLGAPFAAVLVIIINAGAIMVLFVFVIMMLNLGQQAIEQEKSWLSPRTWAGPAALTAASPRSRASLSGAISLENSLSKNSMPSAMVTLSKRRQR